MAAPRATLQDVENEMGGGLHAPWTSENLSDEEHDGLALLLEERALRAPAEVA